MRESPQPGLDDGLPPPRRAREDMDAAESVGMGAALIAGIVIGAAAGTLLLGALLWFAMGGR